MPSGYLHVTPRAPLVGASAATAVGSGWAWPFRGGQLAFTALDISVGGPERKRIAAIARKAYEQNLYSFPSEARAVVDDVIAALAAAPAAFAGCAAGPIVMGILNVTPDSFSDGGKYAAPDTAVARGVALAEAGADIIDVGGESTRPGATPVDPTEEAARVLPVISDLASRGLCVSVDTRHASVMSAAIAAGARIVNDITALTGDPAARDVVARSNASVILMHMQGEPRTMQANPTYAWAPGDVYDVLAARVAACTAAGIAKDRIAVDPGLGFGKTAAHSLDILDHIALFHGLGCAVAVGASRKSFLGALKPGEGAAARLPGSLAAAVHAAVQGVQIVRVHDVAETRQALALSARLTDRV